MKKNYYLGRYASIIYRQSNRFYDRELAPYFIGCGQQFFLLLIFKHQGTSVLDLARMGQYDKGTATRAVQKLEEEGYIRSALDPQDRRIRRLYTTPSAEAVVRAVFDARERWNQSLTQGLSQEEIELADKLLDRMSKNILNIAEREEGVNHEE